MRQISDRDYRMVIAILKGVTAPADAPTKERNRAREAKLLLRKLERKL